VQEDFTQHGGSLLQKLEGYIAECDRVILLVGSAYGWAPEPVALPKDAPVRSYTQWEYHFALGERLDGTRAPAKQVYVYFATPDYLQGYPIEQSVVVTQRQQLFIDAIKASGKDRNEFDSINHLARLVLRDGFKLSNPDRYLLQNLPYDSLGSLFKGRDTFIEQIRANLTANTGQATAIVAKQAIHGLGGVGKTRLVVEYAWHSLADYSACLFVTADSPENLQRNLAALCQPRLLDLPEQNEPEQERQLAAVLQWLDRHPGWLLILDNVDSPEVASAVDELLPQLQQGHVLVTSRLSNWGGGIRSLALDTLDEESAVAFLLEKTAELRTPTDSDVETARSLALTLGGLALGLEQAGAFINRKHLSLLAYRQRWEQQEQKLRHWFDEREMHYPKSLAVTWETSFEQLSPSAQALLNLLAWFAPAPIPRQSFEASFTPETLTALLEDAGSATQATTAPPDLEDLLDELSSLSLLKWESGNQAFTIHRLVQEISQARLPDEARDQALRAVLSLINQALPADPPPIDVRAWPFWDPWRPHLEQLVQAADQATIAKPTTRLMNDLGQYLDAKGLLGEAEPLMRRALAIDEASYGSDHPNVASLLNNLAQLLQATNRLAEAEPLMRRALVIDEASYGSDHPDVARDLNNLALLLKATNRLSEAEPLMHRALTIDEASYGSDHPNVARDLNNLAALLQATNRLEEAEPLMHRALAIDEASYGSDHPMVAIRLNNLAQLLQATNRLEEAEPLMRRALAIDEASYGSDHPMVAIRLNNLAQLLQATNRLEEAETLMRRALAIDESSYGSDHPDVARDLNNLAKLLLATNRLAEAEPLMRRALAIDEASFGSEHPKVGRDLNNLAQLLKATNRLAEAEPLMRRALTIDEASYGPKHPDVAIKLNNLAVLLKTTNRLAEAEPLMRRALKIDEASYGPEHPNVAIDLSTLAQLLQATNRLAEAEPLMHRSLKIDEASYGLEHPRVARDLNNLAQLLKATNRLAEAEPLMRRALTIDEASYGPEHPNVGRDLNNLAQLLKATNRLAEAEPLMRRTLTIDEASYGSEHPNVGRDLNNLALLLKATNRLVEAEPLMHRVVEIVLLFTLRTGHEHPHLNTALENYRILLMEMGQSEEEAKASIGSLIESVQNSFNP
jgi:tetratricopeptide (TPR) repeat protein